MPNFVQIDSNVFVKAKKKRNNEQIVESITMEHLSRNIKYCIIT